MAAAVPAPGDTPGTADRQGSHGPQAGRESVVDVAECEVRFARGTAWNSPWCVMHRDNEEAFEQVIMLPRGGNGEMVGSDRVRPARLEASPRLEWRRRSNESEMARSS